MTKSIWQQLTIGKSCRWVLSRCRMSLKSTMILVTVLVALVALYAMYVNVVAVGNAVVEIEEEQNCYVCYESNKRLSPQQEFLTKWFGKPYGTPVIGLVTYDRVNVPLAEKIGKLKSLRHLVIYDDLLSDAELLAIGGLPEIRTLYLESKYLEGWGLRNLCSGRQIEKLTLRAPNVTSNAQRPLLLDRVKKLRFYQLSQSSKEFFAGIQAAKNLEELTFTDSSAINGVDMIHFPNLPHLKKLEVLHCDLAQSDLLFLDRTPNLEHLHLENSFKIPRDVARIGVCRQLKSLHLNRNAHLASNDMFWLRQLELLEHLNLSETGVDSMILDIISDIPRLRTLDLSWTDFEEKGHLYLRGSESLEELSLANCKVGGSVGAILSIFPNLRRLDLSNCSLGDDDLASWPKHNCLQELSLSRNKSLTAQGLELLPNLPELKVLDINETSVSGDLRTLERYRKLESLSIVMPLEAFERARYGGQVTTHERNLRIESSTDENANELAVKLPKLAELKQVRIDCHWIDGQSWKSLANLPNLELLSLSHCEFELVELKGKLPQLQQVVSLDISDFEFSLSEFPILDTVPKIRSLNIGSSRKIFLNDILFLRDLEHLTISVSHVTHTEASLQKLRQLASLKSMDFDTYAGSDPPLKIFPPYWDNNQRHFFERWGWEEE